MLWKRRASIEQPPKLKETSIFAENVNALDAPLEDKIEQLHAHGFPRGG